MTDQAAMHGMTRWLLPLLAVCLVALLGVLVVSGQWPELRSKVAFAPKGLVTIAPADAQRVEIRSDSGSVVLLRKDGEWTIDGVDGAVSSELKSHLETALQLVTVSEPAREISAAELTAASFAAFGLDPPTTVAVIEAANGSTTSVNLGALNPASTSHYVRIAGRPKVYLMPRHFGEEWRVTLDMARRLRGTTGPDAANRGKSLLLPVSMAQVWALEIVFAGKLTRFERDAAGNWFRHLGQHNHAAGNLVHVADPEQARTIDAALRAFDAAAVETRIGPADPSQLARYGLNLPSLIVLVFARDASAPLARLEFGASADSLDRYARLAPNGAVVTVAEFEMRRLTELLRAVGAGS
ncbi:DUF4340 domain-containing protein [Bradyrhizobium sp. CB1650]|uniref:DUF4340 domain-containing protein n=1 Tax=Bradyrhizobium sp. CB1650 TaxID=3039153 RepID=UPI0024348EFA|nr:DUF4340 domain-containing protein [Bradyrhizobium sp. CB1650]WGD50713.1 DUF4340 domain-containing protein [Bradyrhizobium sp. CB1650]